MYVETRKCGIKTTNSRQRNGRLKNAWDTGWPKRADGEAREGVEHNAVHESSTKWTYKTLELRNQGTGKEDGQKEPIWGSGKSPWGNMARRGESFRAGELGEKGRKEF